MSVFKGTVGNAPVVMELDEGGTQTRRHARGRYFYVKQGVDIPLDGPLDALREALPLAGLDPAPNDEDRALFVDPATGKPRILWRGQLTGDHYAGTWHDARTGKTLAFDLRQVGRYDPEAVRPDSVEAVTLAIVQGASSGVGSDVAISMRATPYDYLRLDVPLRTEREVLRGAVAYRMVWDPRTRFRYPQLTRHPDARMLARINALLQQRHWALSLQALACASAAYTSQGPEAGTLGNFDNETVAVDYLSPALMSVVESGSTGCGGAHPNNHYEPYTLDLLRGEYFDFRRLLKGYARGEYVPEYSEAFMRFVNREVRRQGRAAEGADVECTDIWPGNLYLHFQAPGKLSFDVSGVGHAMGVCLGSHLSLPFRALKPILKPDAQRYLGSVS